MKTYKRTLCYLLLICFSVQIFIPGSTAKASTVPSVSAHAYVIMDANSGEILLSQNANNKIYPASTVKLMTALVTLDYHSLSDKITITKKMLKQVPAGCSNAGLHAGSTYTVSDLLHMLLLPSAADAAICLSVDSCGSVKKFVSNMNKKADELGFQYTSFDNPIGLDIGNNYYKTYTTANEFATLARYAMANTKIRSIVKKKSYRVPKTKNHAAFTIKNTNAFLSSKKYNKNLYTIIGSKTGTTNAAGSVLITTATDAKGHEIICAFFGNSSHDKMYDDIKKLLNYTFKEVKSGDFSLQKGYLDVRFRDTEQLIHNYCTQGKIPQTTKFYPTKKGTQNELLSLLNRINNTNFEPIAGNDTLSILDFAKIYSVTTSNLTATNVSNSSIQITDLTSFITSCSDYDNIENCSDIELNALANLIDSSILPKDIDTNINTKLTKENMVVIAKNLEKK